MNVKKTIIRLLVGGFVGAAITVIITILLAVYLILNSAPSEEEEQEVTDKGTEIMEDWIAEYYPQGSITSIEPYITFPQPYELTDYATGTLYDGNRERTFNVNVVTGYVTVEADEEMQEAFLEYSLQMYCESLGLDRDTEIDSFNAYIVGYPLCTGAKDYKATATYEYVGLPGELVALNGDVESYMKSNREEITIGVKGWFKVSDDMSLSGYTMEDLANRQEQYDIKYEYLIIANKYENVHLIKDYKYECWEYEDWNGRTAWNRCVYVESEYDDNGNIVTNRYTSNVNECAEIIKTENGYQIVVEPDREIKFELYVPDGDEMLKNNYNQITPGYEEDNVRAYYWAKHGEGWTLETINGSVNLYYKTTELVIRN